MYMHFNNLTIGDQVPVVAASENAKAAIHAQYVMGTVAALTQDSVVVLVTICGSLWSLKVSKATGEPVDADGSYPVCEMRVYPSLDVWDEQKQISAITEELKTFNGFFGDIEIVRKGVQILVEEGIVPSPEDMAKSDSLCIGQWAYAIGDDDFVPDFGPLVAPILVADADQKIGFYPCTGKTLRCDGTDPDAKNVKMVPGSMAQTMCDSDNLWRSHLLMGCSILEYDPSLISAAGLKRFHKALMG